MCKLSEQEEKVMVNLKRLKRKDVASTLGISPRTVDAYLNRIKRKRKECNELLARTNPYKTILYPKRKGE